MDQVNVSNFSSLLEIVFAVNFLFFLFQIRPIFAAKWHQMFEQNKEEGKAEVLHWLARSDTRWGPPKSHTMFITFIALELLTTAFTLMASAIAIGLLYNAGLDEGFTIDKWEMDLFLVFSLGTLPVYFIGSWSLIDGAKKSLQKHTK